MRYMILFALFLIVLEANGVAVRGLPRDSGGIDRYCRLQRRLNHQASEVDLVVSVMLNSGEMISVTPDADRLSDYYRFSTWEKDAVVSSFLQQSNAVARLELIKSRIRDMSSNAIPDNCVVAMTRLGMECEYNRRYPVSYHVVSNENLATNTNMPLRMTLVLSKDPECRYSRDDLPIRIVSNRIDADDARNCIVMLREKDFFWADEKSAAAYVSVVYLRSGAVCVKVIFF